MERLIRPGLPPARVDIRGDNKCDDMYEGACRHSIYVYYQYKKYIQICIKS